MTSWMYERAKRHMSRNTEAYDDGNKRRSEDVNKRAREGEKLDCLCVLKLKLINQV